MDSEIKVSFLSHQSQVMKMLGDVTQKPPGTETQNVRSEWTMDLPNIIYNANKSELSSEDEGTPEMRLKK
jgi:hypothetical protein